MVRNINSLLKQAIKKDVKIEIDTSQPKHLLIKGANGSRKTTVLNECRLFLDKVLDKHIDELFTKKSRNEIFEPKEYSLSFLVLEILTVVKDKVSKIGRKITC
jgi:predicted ATP-binding protein involved in virulence